MEFDWWNTIQAREKLPIVHVVQWLGMFWWNFGRCFHGTWWNASCLAVSKIKCHSIPFRYKIPFCHIRLRSVTCHILVNNLHFITILIALSNLSEKNPQGTNCYWYWVFHAIFPRLTFSTNSSRFKLPKTRNRGCYVTRLNNGCEGDNSKRDTDVFHFH